MLVKSKRQLVAALNLEWLLKPIARQNVPTLFIMYLFSCRNQSNRPSAHISASFFTYCILVLSLKQL